MTFKKGYDERRIKTQFKKGHEVSKTIREKISFANKGKTTWNGGLTKETDERVKRNGEQTSKTKKRLFKEGKLKCWSKGLTKEIDEGVRKMSQAKQGEKNPMYNKKGINHPQWKGDDVSYSGVHDWVRKHKPKPKFCEECGEEKKLSLANIKNHNYTRNIEDYKWICYKCHRKMDIKPFTEEHKKNIGLARKGKKKHPHTKKENETQKK